MVCSALMLLAATACFYQCDLSCRNVVKLLFLVLLLSVISERLFVLPSGRVFDPHTDA